jgi:dinuclear metal center YbgI/SA1388 family protein
MEKFAPLSLADASWDNVGILVENPKPNGANVVVLTIDLTPSVLEECIANHAEVIISYHPPIFAPMKHLTLKSVKESIVLRTIVQGMSIFSPHTSIDAAIGGINDWLAHAIDAKGSVCPIEPAADHLNLPGAGMGRVLTTAAPMTLPHVVDRLKQNLGLPTVRVAKPHEWSPQHSIHRIAICAGSGSSVFRKLSVDVDLVVSGEMGHHEVLAANGNNQAVVLCEHTNSERGFLSDVLAPFLRNELGESTQVYVSEADRDPLVVW